MNGKDLIPFVTTIVLVGLILGIAVILQDEMGERVTYTLTANSSFTYPHNASNASLPHPSILSGTFHIYGTANSTEFECPASNYTLYASDGNVEVQVNDNSTILDCCMHGNTTYAEYSFIEVNSSTKLVAESNITAVKPITEDWLPLIIVIVAISVVLGFVFLVFKPGGR